MYLFCLVSFKDHYAARASIIRVFYKILKCL